MSDADLNKRVRTSMFALQGRQALMMLGNLGVGILLSRKLDPAVFGLFGIASFCLSIITMAMDFGLAGALVQRKEDFDHHEISVAFTLQLGLALVAAALVWVLAPLSLLVYRQAPPELVWIIRSLTLAIVISPIGTVARLQLEREIKFQKIATIDVLSMIVNNAVVLLLIFTDHGVWSFVWGNIAGSAATVAVSWFMIRTRPGIAFDKALARKLLSYGAFFQFTSITNSAAGWVIPLVSGAFLGPRAVGLLTWASSNGRRPLMVVDNVMRVAFPHFSRLQDKPEGLGRQIELYMSRLLILCFGWATLSFLMGKTVTHLVYTDKWLPGVLPFQLFAAGLALDVANWVGGMSLMALGGVKETAKWTTIKSIVAIGGAIVLVHPLGIVGIPLAALVASAVAGAGIVIRLRKQVPIRMSVVLRPIWPYAGLLVLHLPFSMASEMVQSIASWAFGTVAFAWMSIRLVHEFRPDLLQRWRPSP